jgi:hypothetical protein
VSYGAAKSGLNHMTRSLAQEWADDHRELPLVRVTDGRSDGREVCRSSLREQPISSTAPTIESDGGMLPGVLYEAGLKTITDLL